MLLPTYGQLRKSHGMSIMRATAAVDWLVCTRSTCPGLAIGVGRAFSLFPFSSMVQVLALDTWELSCLAVACPLRLALERHVCRIALGTVHRPLSTVGSCFRRVF